MTKKAQRTDEANFYTIPFSAEQWDELAALSFDPFVVEPRQALTRQQWLALAHMALGKALLIEGGRYDMGDQDDDDNDSWADDLRTIANTILDTFQPGDGQM